MNAVFWWTRRHELSRADTGSSSRSFRSSMCSGTLAAALMRSPTGRRDDRRATEAMMQFEVDRETEPERLEALVGGIRRVCR